MQNLGGAGGEGGGRETRCIMVFVKMVNSFIFIFLFYFISFAKKKKNKQTERTFAGTPQQLWTITASPVTEKKKKKKNIKKPSDSRKTTNSHIHTSY